MAIGYVIQKKLIQVGSSPGMKYLARIFREKPVTQEQIAKSISDHSSLSIGDVYNVFQCFKEEIAKQLSEGKSVKIDLLGTFYSSIKSIAQDDFDKVKSTTIDNVNVKFLPSKELIQIVRSAGLKYIDTNIKGVQYRDLMGGKSFSDDFDPESENYDSESQDLAPNPKDLEENPEKNELKDKK